MKVLVIGDSYGLPRYAKNSFNVELDYAGTYPEQLRRMLSANFTEDVCLVNRCRHANTSLSLIKGEANEIEFLRPDYTILQLGLVDLWPAEGRKIWPLYSEQYGRDPWVTPDEYKNNLQLFLNFAKSRGSKVIVINNPPVEKVHLLKHAGLEKKIVLYNNLLTRLMLGKSVNLLEWYDRIKSLDGKCIFGSDGIHPTREAANLLARLLLQQISLFEDGVVNG